MAETYFYGQGRIEAAPITGGTIGDYRFIGDVSAMSLALAIEKVEHKESYSGQKALVRSFPVGKTATLSMTLHSIETDNLAMVLYGTAQTTPAGSIVDEVIGTPNAGDRITLSKTGISNLTLKQDDGTLIDAAHFALLDNGHYGEFEIISIPAGALFPFTASFDYAATKAVGMFSAAQPTVAIRYKGLNLAEGNAPVLVELYKVATDPLAELSLITDGTALAGMQISGGVLLDSSKPASSALGQFGHITQLA